MNAIPLKEETNAAKNTINPSQTQIKQEFETIFQTFNSETNLPFSYGNLFQHENHTEDNIETKPLDSIEIKGLKHQQLTLPLTEESIQLIKSKAEKAPFGKGFNTVHDINVRDTWQIDAKDISFPSNPYFLTEKIHQYVQFILQTYLQINCQHLNIHVHFYKLLLYETNGHFQLHRDTEKEPGMFATYLMQLPTTIGYEGGLLTVQQGDTLVNYDFTSQSQTSFYEALFYADCQHELIKLTKGYRVVLAFNVIWQQYHSELTQLTSINQKLTSTAIHLQGLTKFITSLQPIISKWKHTKTSVKKFIVFPLKHQYTRKNFSFTGLKGEDCLLAQALLTSSDEIELLLFLRTKKVTGQTYADSDDSSDDFRYRYRKHGRDWFGDDDGEVDEEEVEVYYDDDDEDDDDDDEEGSRKLRYEGFHTMEDIIETDYEESWKNINNQTIRGYNIDFSTDVIGYNQSDDTKLFDDQKIPDEEEYEGYTGNAGPTLDYFYHKAFVVMIQKHYILKSELKYDFEAYMSRILHMITYHNGKIHIEHPNTIQQMLKKAKPYIQKNWIQSTTNRKDLFLFAGIAIQLQDMETCLLFLLAIKNDYSFEGKKTFPLILLLIQNHIDWNNLQPVFQRILTSIRNLYSDKKKFELLQLIHYLQTNNQIEICQKLLQCITHEMNSIPIGDYNLPNKIKYFNEVSYLCFIHNMEILRISQEFQLVIENIYSKHNVLQLFLDHYAISLATELPDKTFLLIDSWIQSRYEYLQANFPPVFTWSIPIDTKLYEFPSNILKFLQSEEKEYIQQGFNGIAEARDEALYFRQDSSWGLDIRTSGIGKKACLKVTKVTKPYEQLITQQMQNDLQSLEKLQTIYQQQKLIRKLDLKK